LSELTLTLLRLGLLAAMWMFVLGVLSTLRRDLLQTSRTARPQRIAKMERTPRSRRRGSHIVITTSNGEQRKLELGTSPITFGRSEDNVVVLDDDYTSTHHARIVPRERGWVVEDLGSTNGTWVDRRRITGATLLHSGQRIRIGKTELEVRT